MRRCCKYGRSKFITFYVLKRVIGRIIDEYDMATLKKHIMFLKITKQQADRLKDYLLRYDETPKDA